MYNDYYLQQIDSKLNTIINNQEEIILQNQTLISGDTLIYNSFENFKNLDLTVFVWIFVILFSILFYKFYHSIFNHNK